MSIDKIYKHYCQIRLLMDMVIEVFLMLLIMRDLLIIILLILFYTNN